MMNISIQILYFRNKNMTKQITKNSGHQSSNFEFNKLPRRTGVGNALRC